MTNEELDEARVDEAYRQAKECPGQGQNFPLIVARLAREGWTPPEPVDPDIAEAEAVWFLGKSAFDLVFEGIKRGRALAAEAKPGLVWKVHDGSGECPVRETEWVTIRYVEGLMVGYTTGIAKHREWPNVTHYAVITQPGGVA